jgi:hypothetical protein
MLAPLWSQHTCRIARKLYGSLPFTAGLGFYYFLAGLNFLSPRLLAVVAAFVL